MNTITVKYDLVWQFKEHPQYQVTRCKKVFNVRRGVQLKQVLNGGSIGFWIAGKFIPISKVNEKVELIKSEKLPF